jgi:hypothetical protein
VLLIESLAIACLQESAAFQGPFPYSLVRQ